MAAGEWHPVLDPSISEAIVEATPEWVAFVLVFLTHFGSIFVVVPVVVLAYWWAPERMGAWIPAVFAYYGLMASIKSLNSATRPAVAPPVGPEPFPPALSTWYEHATAISSTSFPSGNAMVATLVVGLLVVDLRIGTFGHRSLVGGFVIALVGYSRLGLGVHYPIDVVVGIALGLTLLAIVVLARRHLDDGVTAVFVLAVVLAFASVWLRSGGFGVPTWEHLQGSNRTLAFGGAVGGLLVWRWGRATEWGFATRSLGRLSSFGILVAIVAGTYAIHVTVTHPLVAMLWAAVVFGAVVAGPHVVPTRDDVEAALGDPTD